MSETTSRTITLGGIDYQVRRMTIGQLCDIEALALSKDRSSSSNIRLAADVVKVALRRNYPDLNLSDDLEVSAADLRQAMAVVMDVAGFADPAAASAEQQTG